MTAGTTRVVAVAAALAVLVAGCTGKDDPEVASPLAGCDQLAEPPAPAPAPAVRAAGPDTERLPALTLPCFTGGEPFALADLRGPAVVNLWASWCPPCREELPVLQRYADRAAGSVHVVGVVTEDRRSAAASLAADLGISFPALDDPDAALWAGLSTLGLPTTVFLAEDGQIRYVHQGVALDESTLERMVSEHLGGGSQ